MIYLFYATLEVWAQKEKLIWMTGTHRFKATFNDLTTAMGLNYHKMKWGKLVADLLMLLAGEILDLHCQETSRHGP